MEPSRRSQSSSPTIPLTSASTNGASNNKMKMTNTSSPTTVTSVSVSSSATNGRQSASPFGSPIFQQQPPAPAANLDTNEEPKNGSSTNSNFSSSVDKNDTSSTSNPTPSTDHVSRHPTSNRDQLKPTPALHESRHYDNQTSAANVMRVQREHPQQHPKSVQPSQAVQQQQNIRLDNSGGIHGSTVATLSANEQTKSSPASRSQSSSISLGSSSSSRSGRFSNYTSVTNHEAATPIMDSQQHRHLSSNEGMSRRNCNSPAVPRTPRSVGTIGDHLSPINDPNGPASPLSVPPLSTANETQSRTKSKTNKQFSLESNPTTTSAAAASRNSSVSDLSDVSDQVTLKNNTLASSGPKTVASSSTPSTNDPFAETDAGNDDMIKFQLTDEDLPMNIENLETQNDTLGDLVEGLPPFVHGEEDTPLVSAEDVLNILRMDNHNPVHQQNSVNNSLILDDLTEPLTDGNTLINSTVDSSSIPSDVPPTSSTSNVISQLGIVSGSFVSSNSTTSSNSNSALTTMASVSNEVVQTASTLTNEFNNELMTSPFFQSPSITDNNSFQSSAKSCLTEILGVTDANKLIKYRTPSVPNPLPPLPELTGRGVDDWLNEIQADDERLARMASNHHSVQSTGSFATNVANSVSMTTSSSVTPSPVGDMLSGDPKPTVTSLPRQTQQAPRMPTTSSRMTGYDQHRFSGYIRSPSQARMINNPQPHGPGPTNYDYDLMHGQQQQRMSFGESRMSNVRMGQPVQGSFISPQQHMAPQNTPYNNSMQQSLMSHDNQMTVIRRPSSMPGQQQMCDDAMNQRISSHVPNQMMGTKPPPVNPMSGLQHTVASIPEYSQGGTPGGRNMLTASHLNDVASSIASPLNGARNHAQASSMSPGVMTSDKRVMNAEDPSNPRGLRKRGHSVDSKDGDPKKESKKRRKTKSKDDQKKPNIPATVNEVKSRSNYTSVDTQLNQFVFSTGMANEASRLMVHQKAGNMMSAFHSKGNFRITPNLIKSFGMNYNGHQMMINNHLPSTGSAHNNSNNKMENNFRCPLPAGYPQGMSKQLGSIDPCVGHQKGNNSDMSMASHASPASNYRNDPGSNRVDDQHNKNDELTAKFNKLKEIKDMITGGRSKKEPNGPGNNQQPKLPNQWPSFSNAQSGDNRYELTSAMQEAFRTRNLPLKGVSEQHLTPQITIYNDLKNRKRAATNIQMMDKAPVSMDTIDPPPPYNNQQIHQNRWSNMSVDGGNVALHHNARDKIPMSVAASMSNRTGGSMDMIGNKPRGLSHTKQSMGDVGHVGGMHRGIQQRMPVVSRMTYPQPHPGQYINSTMPTRGPMVRMQHDMGHQSATFPFSEKLKNQASMYRPDGVLHNLGQSVFDQSDSITGPRMTSPEWGFGNPNQMSHPIRMSHDLSPTHAPLGSQQPGMIISGPGGMPGQPQMGPDNSMPGRFQPSIGSIRGPVSGMHHGYNVPGQHQKMPGSMPAYNDGVMGPPINPDMTSGQQPINDNLVMDMMNRPRPDMNQSNTIAKSPMNFQTSRMQGPVTSVMQTATFNTNDMCPTGPQPNHMPAMSPHNPVNTIQRSPLGKSPAMGGSGVQGQPTSSINSTQGQFLQSTNNMQQPPQNMPMDQGSMLPPSTPSSAGPNGPSADWSQMPNPAMVGQRFGSVSRVKDGPTISPHPLSHVGPSIMSQEPPPLTHNPIDAPQVVGTQMPSNNPGQHLNNNNMLIRPGSMQQPILPNGPGGYDHNLQQRPSHGPSRSMMVPYQRGDYSNHGNVCLSRSPSQPGAVCISPSMQQPNMLGHNNPNGQQMMDLRPGTNNFGHHGINNNPGPGNFQGQRMYSPFDLTNILPSEKPSQTLSYYPVSNNPVVPDNGPQEQVLMQTIRSPPTNNTHGNMAGRYQHVPNQRPVGPSVVTSNFGHQSGLRQVGPLSVSTGGAPHNGGTFNCPPNYPVQQQQGAPAVSQQFDNFGAISPSASATWEQQQVVLNRQQQQQQQMHQRFPSGRPLIN